MTESSSREVADSLGATSELLPFVPELLADIWALGSSPDVMVDLLRPLGLPARTTRVFELGCGKGAIAITLAQELGFNIFGIDLFQPFIQEAKRRAEEARVEKLCRFACCDMHDTVLKARNFDVLIYAAVGGVLGKFDECVGKLRQCVRPAGYMVIDDGFLPGDKKMERPGYEHYSSHDETLRRLTAHGDILLREVNVSAEEMWAYNKTNTDFIRKRAESLAKLHPEVAESFAWYVKQQEEECEILETKVTGAVWLLQRT